MWDVQDYWGTWDGLVQFGLLCGFVVFANMLRRKIPFLRKSLIPSALIGGIIALILKSSLPQFSDWLDLDFLNNMCYHAICFGFIALTLKQKYGKKGASVRKKKGGEGFGKGLNSGSTIVGTYLIQGVIGLLITLLLSFAMSGLFGASGMLLPIGFGQGPGQANNFGTMYENGVNGSEPFVGGQSFALTIASIGTLIGSVVMVIFLNIMKRKGKIKFEEIEASSKISESDPEDEMPLSEPVDRLTMNIGTIMVVFLATCGFLFGMKALLSGFDFGKNTLLPLFFGFNFIFGMAFAGLYKVCFKGLKKRGLIKHEYTNNQTLNRISGSVFDFMIITSLMLIDVTVLPNLILPLVLLCVIGAAVTYLYIWFISKKIAKGYEIEYFVAMYGMLTGTISTGISVLRLIDPNFKTEASNDLVVGSSFAVVLGAPMLLLMTLAPTQPWLAFGILVGLFILINLLLFRNFIFKRRRKGQNESAEPTELAEPVETIADAPAEI